MITTGNDASTNTSTRLQRVDDLMVLVARGDASAYEQVYSATAHRVNDVARHVLVDWAMAEDVTQEVFLEAWRTAARFDRTRGSAIAWLVTMAHRRAVDRVRAEQASRRRDSTQWESVAPDDVVADVSDQVMQRLQERQVRGCLDVLSDKQHEAIVLAYFGGLTYVEVARQLNIPVSTTKTRIRDGLSRMRPALVRELALGH